MTLSERQVDRHGRDPEEGPGSEDDYSANLAAVMETARGRWFLAEYARRNRHADTQMLLEALARLETAITSAGDPPASDASARPSLATGPTLEIVPAGDTPSPPPTWQDPPSGPPLPAAGDTEREAATASHESAMPADADPPPPQPAANIFTLSFEEKLALFS